MEVAANDVARALHELIAALDRRAPRADHAREHAIARDAAMLRHKAVEQLRELDADSKATNREAALQ